MDLLCSRGISELAADRVGAIVAPCLGYGPGVDAVGSPKHGSLEVGVPVFLPHAAAAVAGLVDLVSAARPPMHSCRATAWAKCCERKPAAWDALSTSRCGRVRGRF